MATKDITRNGEIIKKSNALCRARWSPESVWELRLVALLASKVRQDDTDFHIYEIPVAKVMRDRNQSGKAYQEIAAVVDRTMSRVITIKDDVGRGWIKYNVFLRCRYRPNDGVLELGIHPDLREHYLNLQRNFAQYSLLEYLTLPSIYSQRIYEILKSWNDRPEVTIALSELHEMLTVPKTLRADFFNFRRRVLEKAHRDISSKTSLRYQWEPKKTGRAVTAIKFWFEKTPQAKPKLQPLNVDNGPNAVAALDAELRSLGVHSKTASDYAARAEAAGRVGLILARLPGIVARADKQPNSTRLQYILGAVQNELQQQQIFDVPAGGPVDPEAEARKCRQDHEARETICVPRQTGEPDGRKRCQMCLEKIPRSISETDSEPPSRNNPGRCSR